MNSFSCNLYAYLDELPEENERLLNKLIFVNKCLNYFIKFKAFLIQYNMFIDNCDSINSQKNELNES